MITRYGDRKSFLSIFNPDLQMKVCKDTELCLFGDAPVLSELNMAYGEMTATMWLVPQLYNLSEYCGCRDKLQGKPLEECASVIATDYYYLKVSELMLFFHRFKSGRYGRFYGAVDPLVITTSLRDFVKERNVEIHEHERKMQEEADREYAKTAISYEQYVSRYGKPENVRPGTLKNPVSAVGSKDGKKDGSPLSKEFLLSQARDIMCNANGLSTQSLDMMRKLFVKHANMTPEEYVRENDSQEVVTGGGW